MLDLFNPSLNAIAVGRQAFGLDSIQDSGFRGVLTQEVKEKEQIKLNDRAIMDVFMGGGETVVFIYAASALLSGRFRLSVRPH